MKPLISGRILVVLLALIVGVALGAGLVGALRAPAPPNVKPIQLENDEGLQPGKDDKEKRGNGNRDGSKDKRPPRNEAPPPRNDPPAGGGAPPPPPPPPPGDDDDDDDDGGDSDDGGDDD